MVLCYDNTVKIVESIISEKALREKGKSMRGSADETLLIQKAKAGDDRSFELLVEGCRTKAYNTALRYLRNEEDAMDALQESLIKVFRHLDKFKGDCKFNTWVYRIVVNTCNDILRKNSSLKQTESLYKNSGEGETVIEIKDTAPTPLEAFERLEDTQFLLDCLEMLSMEQKEIIILRDIQGFSYEQISEIQSCSVGTVKSRINRARGRLKMIFLEQMDGDCV